MEEIVLTEKEKRQVGMLLEFDSLKIHAAFRKIIMNDISFLITTNDSNWGNGSENILCYKHDLSECGEPMIDAVVEMGLTEDIPAFANLLRRLAKYDYISIKNGNNPNVLVCGCFSFPVVPGSILTSDEICFGVLDKNRVQRATVKKNESLGFTLYLNGHEAYSFSCYSIPGQNMTDLLDSSITINQKLVDYVSNGFVTQAELMNQKLADSLSDGFTTQTKILDQKLDKIDLHIQETKDELLNRFRGLYMAVIEHNSTVHTIQHKEPALYTKLRESLQKKNLHSFKESISSLLSSIAYDSIKEADKEGYYHVILHTIFSLIGGFTVNSEIETNNGRIDLEVKLEERTYIFEFKFDEKKDKSDEALAQSFGYVNALKNEGKEIVCVGMGFVTDKEHRNIVNMKYRTMYRPK